MNLPTIIDVAIGLVLMFFILASLGSVLAEFVAAHQKWRHNLLRQTVTRLLEPEIARRFWVHPLILPLFARTPRAIATAKAATAASTTAIAFLVAKELETGSTAHVVAPANKQSGWTRFKRKVTSVTRLFKTQVAEAPAYLDPVLFASVVLDLSTGEGAVGRLPATTTAWAYTIRTYVPDKPGENNDLQDRLLALLRQVPADAADCGAALKANVAQWYNEAMARTSGEYRRRLQKVLLIIGGLLAIGFNCDALRIATVLYQSPTLRAQVAQQAETLVKEKSAEAAQPASAGNGPDTKQQIKVNVEQLRDLSKIGFPLGWAPTLRENFILMADDATVPGINSLLAKFAGLLATALAVCLGAPFWFDLLGRLVKLRSSAGADAEKSKSGAAATDPTQGNAPAGSTTAIAATGSGSATAPAAPRPLPSFFDALSSASTDFTAGRAYWLAQAANHAYETNRDTARTWLSQQGQTNVQFFDQAGTNTQAFLSWGDGVALLAFRGTEQNLTDWTTDAEFELVDAGTHGLPGKIHHGFAAALESIWPDLLAALDQLKGQRVLLHVTGHSLGGALATLAALRLAKLRTFPIQSVHTYGSPRVGDEAFAREFEASFTGRAFRVVNNEDLVTRIPPRESGYKHVNAIIYIDEAGRIQRDIGYWYRFLNFVTNALDDLKKALQTTVKDHSMALYCGHLERAAKNPDSVV